MYMKQQEETNGFVKSLNVCIESMIKQINFDYNQQMQSLNEWKKSQENIVNQCKKYAMDQIGKMFDEITTKQISSFDDFQKALSSQNDEINGNHVNQLKSVLN